MESVLALLLGIALGIFTPSEVLCEVSGQSRPAYHCEMKMSEYKMVIEGQIYVTKHTGSQKMGETYY